MRLFSYKKMRLFLFVSFTLKNKLVKKYFHQKNRENYKKFT